VQINVSGGPQYKLYGSAAAPAVVAETAAAEAVAAAAAPGSRCHVGPGAAGALLCSWEELVERAAGRECPATVALKFFGRQRLYLPRALVVDEEKAASGCCGPDGTTPAALAPGAPVSHQPEGAGRIAAAYFEFDWLCGARRLARATPPEELGGPTPPEPGRGVGVDATGGPLAAIDCLALAESGVGAVFLEGVPLLGPGVRDAAMRFATLIDVLYDHGARREWGRAVGADGGDKRGRGGLALSQVPCCSSSFLAGA
jgi:hypothetical protein